MRTKPRQQSRPHSRQLGAYTERAACCIAQRGQKPFGLLETRRPDGERGGGNDNYDASLWNVQGESAPPELDHEQESVQPESGLPGEKSTRSRAGVARLFVAQFVLGSG